MSRKLRFSTVLLLVFVMLFSMAACDNGEVPEPEEKSYSISVVDGTASASSATAGTVVTLTANSKTGHEFAGWTSDVTGLAIENNSFVMPASDVSIAANFNRLSYTLTVTGGTAEVGGTPVTGSVEYGAEVVLTPGAPEQGYKFSGWTGVTVANNKFYMPAQNVSVTANYVLETLSALTISDDDVTFLDSSKVAEVTEGGEFPEIVNNNEEVDVAGWYEVDDESNIWNHTSYPMFLTDAKAEGDIAPRFTMPARAITVAPFFVEAGMRPLVAGGGNTVGSTAKDTDNRTKTIKFFETDLGMQIGTEFTYTGTMSTSDATGYFRFMTATATANNSSTPGVLLEGLHTYNYWFKNTGDVTIKFQAYQILSGTALTGAGASDVIELLPGASCRATLSVTLTVSNNNAMTMIYLRQAQPDLAKLSVVMSKSVANEVA